MGFFRVESYQWLKKKNGTPVANLPGTWHYKVSADAGWPSVNILWLDEMESFICDFLVWKLSERSSRSVPEIHSHVAGMLSNQPKNKQTDLMWQHNKISKEADASMRNSLHVARTPRNQKTNKWKQKQTTCFILFIYFWTRITSKMCTKIADADLWC